MALETDISGQDVPDWRDSALAGLRDASGMLAVAVIFGALFGSSAISAGLDFPQTLAMSIFVFAGTAQFATLALWSQDLPLFAIAISAAMVTSRLALMGLSLAPTIRMMPAALRPAGVFIINDSVWALIMQGRVPVHPVAYYFAASAPMYLLWVLGTAAGVLLTGLIDPVTAKSLAFVGIIFLAILVGMVARGANVPKLPLIVSTLTAAVIDGYVDPGTSLMLAVAAGGLTAIFVTPRKEAVDA